MYEPILSNFALYIVLAPDEQEQVLALLQRKRITKRSILLRSGGIERHIYFVNEGCLRMYHTDKDGQEHNLCFYPENWWACDIVSFFKAKAATNSIQALEDTEVYYVPCLIWKSYLTRYPGSSVFSASSRKTGLICFSGGLRQIFQKPQSSVTANSVGITPGLNSASPKSILPATWVSLLAF